MIGAPIVILGAGVAGLATAWRLATTRATRIVVLEKAARTGGLAGTVSLGDARLDVGSHRIHPEYFPDALALLRGLLGDDLLRVSRRGRLRLNGRYVHYPPSLGEFLVALGPLETVRAAASLLGARLHGRPAARAAARSYEDYLLPLVGRRVYDLFYAPYARKVFGLEPAEVCVTAAKTRITTGRPWKVARQMLARWAARPRGGDDGFFYYPAEGFGSIGDALRDAAVRRGAELVTGADVRALHADGPRIHAVEYARDATERVPAEAVVSTLPLAQLVGAIRPAAPAAVREAAAGLRWRGIRLLQVRLDRTRCLDGDTYYFPEERYCFGRISEPARFSPRLAGRDGGVALNIEVVCSPGDAMWSLDEDAFLARVLDDVRALGLFRREEVLAHRSLRLPAVYPVYDLHYRARLARVLGWIETFENLHSIGRGGLFLHANTDHSIHLGLQVADHLARCATAPRAWRSAMPAEEFRVRD